VRFYIDANPTYAEGHGLLTLVPVTIANTLFSLLGVAFHVLRKRLGTFRRLRPVHEIPQS
jgi:hypothetical protein